MKFMPPFPILGKCRTLTVPLAFPSRRLTPRAPPNRPLVITPSPSPRRIPRIQRGSHAGLPRRRPTDKTRHLEFDQVANLVNAITFTYDQGQPLIVGIVLEWPHVAGFREDRLSNITTRLFDRLGRWMKQHAGVDLRAVWTRERGRNKGHHINIIANIPVSLIGKLNEYLTRSLDIAGGGIKFRCGDYGLRATSMQMGLLRYFCKSLDHHAFVYRGWETCNVADMIGIRHEGTDGLVRVKRAGTTQNIGRKARHEAGWPEMRVIENVAELLNPQSRRRKAA